MSLWLLPLVGIPGLFVFRAWARDAAIRSGELMDLRDVLPSGEAEIELRALADRRYRLELQFEAVLCDPELASATGSAPEPAESARFPFRLAVERSDGAVLYERARELSELFAMASIGPEPSTASGQASGQRIWGSVPILDFDTPALGRLRFDFAIEPRADGGRLEKAQLVLKENVRPLRVARKLLDCVTLEAAVPSPHAL